MARARHQEEMRAASEARETQRVRVDGIVRVPSFQVRAEIDLATVRRYASAMRNGAVFPPVTVAEIDGALILVDGWHRLAALDRNGEIQVEAEIIPATQEEASWLAAKANLAHGKPLKTRELRPVFHRYVKAGKHRKGVGFKSLREMAADIGPVAHTTIRHWLRKDFPSIAKAIGADQEEEGQRASEVPLAERLAASAMRSLDEALAAFQGIKDAARRGEVVRKAEAVAAAMRDATPVSFIVEDDVPF